MHQQIIAFNKEQQKTHNIPDLRAGDVVKIFRRIKEGSKERTQMFQGMVIAIRGRQSSSPMVTVRKVSSGVGVELVLPLNSPQIEKIEFVKRTRARHSKLFFVRDKAAKLLSKKLKEIPLSAGVRAQWEAEAATQGEAPVVAEEAPEEVIEAETETPVAEEAAPLEAEVALENAEPTAEKTAEAPAEITEEKE